jgi:hypothetical protein
MDHPNPHRDLLAEREAYEERLAICTADGIPEGEAHRTAMAQLEATMRAAEDRRRAEKLSESERPPSDPDTPTPA